MRYISALIALSSTLALAGCTVEAGPEVGEDEELEQADVEPMFDKAVVPTIAQHVQNQAGPGGGKTLPINYHSGAPVMLGQVHAYYIWYGNWQGNSATTILTDFMNNLGGSAHWGINTSYYQIINNVKSYVSNSLTLAGQTSVAYPYGTTLSDAQIQSVVADAINSQALPKDASGVYFVLTSADVTASSGFCSSYCGWHSWATIGGADIKYSFVGNADRCLSSCAAYPTGPNGNAGADAMASIIAHEAEEAVTDPKLNAWYDNKGYENADKCAWTFGTVYNAANGAKANIHLGNRDFLIQRNHNATTQACSM